jgi:hypothetical protein
MFSFLFGRKRSSCRKKSRKPKRRCYTRRRKATPFNVPGSHCNALDESMCLSTPGCRYVKGGRGCGRKWNWRDYPSEASYTTGEIVPGSESYASQQSPVYANMGGEGEDVGDYAAEAGIQFFGRRRRRTRRTRRSNFGRKTRCDKGRRRRSRFRRSYVPGSSCNMKKKADCMANKYCHYVRGGQGCKYIQGGRDMEMSERMGMMGPATGPDVLPDLISFDFGRRRRTRRSGFGATASKNSDRMSNEQVGAGVMDFVKKCQSKQYTPLIGCVESALRFGRKRSCKRRSSRRINVPGSRCNKLKKGACAAAGCQYTKKGCRRKATYKARTVGYGKKRLPKAFVKKCRKYGVKTTKKVGRKRVQKSMSMLKKQLRKAMKRRARR